MKKYNIPTADYATFDSPPEAMSYLRKRGTPAVIKADGLAAGKGVMPVQSLNEAEKVIDSILTQRIFGEAGNQIVIEDFLTGEEASFIVFTDGHTILPSALLPGSQTNLRQ